MNDQAEKLRFFIDMYKKMNKIAIASAKKSKSEKEKADYAVLIKEGQSIINGLTLDLAALDKADG